MDDNKLQPKGFLVWSICALFFLYEFFLRTVIGTYRNLIIDDLELTLFQFSLLSTTIFLLVYGIMQIPAGLIVDNIGLKKSLVIAAICCTISSIGFAYSHNYFIALTCRTCMGFGAAFGFICLLISLHDWMPHKYSAIFIGISQFVGTLGPMIAAGPLETISNSTNISWRDIFLLLGLLGFILIVLIFFFVENNRQKAGEYCILYRPEKISTGILRLFSRIQPWYIAFLSAILYFTIEYLSENEGRSFLALKNISSNNAGYMITISWMGYAIGCPLFGFLSDMLKRRKIILTFCSFLALIAIIILIYFKDKLYLQIAFFILGLSAGVQSIGFAMISEQFKKQFVAVGYGLNNAIIITLSAISAPVIALLLDHISDGQSLTLENYVTIFNLLIIMAIIALIISIFFIKETYCKSTVAFTILKINRQ
jgi:MFS family permease